MDNPLDFYQINQFCNCRSQSVDKFCGNIFDNSIYEKLEDFTRDYPFFSSLSVLQYFVASYGIIYQVFTRFQYTLQLLLIVSIIDKRDIITCYDVILMLVNSEFFSFNKNGFVIVSCTGNYGSEYFPRDFPFFSALHVL